MITHLIEPSQSCYTFLICSLDFLHSRQHSSLNATVRVSQMRECLISYKPSNNWEWLLKRTTVHATTTSTQMPLNVQGNLTNAKSDNKNHHLQNLQNSGKEHHQHPQNNITPTACSKWKRFLTISLLYARCIYLHSN